jgi:hypothetical protein
VSAAAIAASALTTYQSFSTSAGLGKPKCCWISRRLFGHSQGYDLVERPLLRDDETMRLAANMNVAVHPAFLSNTNFAFICDNFLIGADGAVERLHKTEPKIWEL